MSIIKDFYRGDLEPYHREVRKCGKYAVTAGRLSDKTDKFISGLSDKESKEFEEIDELRQHVASMVSEDCYILGFRHGAKMMLDILLGENENFT